MVITLWFFLQAHSIFMPKWIKLFITHLLNLYAAIWHIHDLRIILYDTYITYSIHIIQFFVQAREIFFVPKWILCIASSHWHLWLINSVNYLKKYRFLASNFINGKWTRYCISNGDSPWTVYFQSRPILHDPKNKTIHYRKYFTFLWRISKSRLSVFILEGGIEPLNPNELNDEIIDIHKISQIIGLKD